MVQKLKKSQGTRRMRKIGLNWDPQLGVFVRTQKNAKLEP